MGTQLVEHEMRTPMAQGPGTIRVGIVDDDPDVRQKLSTLLDDAEGFVCTGTYADCETALSEIVDNAPDALLMDVGLPGMPGNEGVRFVKHQWPEVEVVMLTIDNSDDTVFESLRNGASGYLLKDATPTEVLRAIAEVVNGGAPMSMSIARKVANSFRTHATSEPLTRREQDVLGLLRQGNSYQAIADDLFISKDTVKYHIKNIYKKLNVANKVNAILKRR